MSQIHSLTPSFTARLAILAISSLFADRFGRVLLEFDEEAISSGFMAHSLDFT